MISHSGATIFLKELLSLFFVRLRRAGRGALRMRGNLFTPSLRIRGNLFTPLLCVPGNCVYPIATCVRGNLFTPSLCMWGNVFTRIRPL